MALFFFVGGSPCVGPHASFGRIRPCGTVASPRGTAPGQRQGRAEFRHARHEKGDDTLCFHPHLHIPPTRCSWAHTPTAFSLRHCDRPAQNLLRSAFRHQAYPVTRFGRRVDNISSPAARASHASLSGEKEGVRIIPPRQPLAAYLSPLRRQVSLS